MRQGRGGNDGVGQLDAVLLAQQDGLLDDGLVEGQQLAAANKLPQSSRFRGVAGFDQQLDLVNNRQVAFAAVNLPHQPLQADGR